MQDVNHVGFLPNSYSISMFLLTEENVMVWEKWTVGEEEKSSPMVFASIIRLQGKNIFLPYANGISFL